MRKYLERVVGTLGKKSTGILTRVPLENTMLVAKVKMERCAGFEPAT